jgi:four helix bundle protein
MAAERTHRDLIAWQEAMNLVEVVYRKTEGFPTREVYGLTAQIRRAAISVPSNIAEGAARNSSREFFQYLGIATGSLAELETQLEISMRLGYLSDGADAVIHVHRVGRLVNALRNAFKIRRERDR